MVCMFSPLRRAAFIMFPVAEEAAKSLLADRWPPGSNRRKRCSKPSAASSMGLRSRTSNRADRAHLPQPSTAHRRSTRIEPHRRTCGHRDATDFFCSALPAHIAPPIPHPSSQFNRSAFFCHAFSRDGFGPIPAPGRFAAFAKIA